MGETTGKSVLLVVELWDSSLDDFIFSRKETRYLLIMTILSSHFH